MKKYRLTEETTKVGNRPLYRIQALRDFGEVKEGELGGYIEAEKNLSQCCDSFIHSNLLILRITIHGIRLKNDE